MASHNFKGADGIRGLACLIVVILHNTSTFIPSSGRLTIGVEKYGVWIFFILSSFLLTFRLINQQPSFSSVFTYLISRFFRIIPAFYICAILFYLNGNFHYQNLIEILLLKGSYAHLWTIPVEFKFYFLLPAFAYFINYLMINYGLRIMLIISTLVVFTHQIIFPFFDVTPNSIEVRWYLPVFLFGVIAAVLKKHNAIATGPATTNIIGVLILAISFIVSPGVIEFFLGDNSSINLMNKFIPLGVIFAVFIYLYCDGYGYIGKALSNPFLRMVGKYSFSIYLYHWFFLSVGVYINLPPLTLIFISISLSLIAGASMYYLVEVPFNHLRSSLERRTLKIGRHTEN